MTKIKLLFVIDSLDCAGAEKSLVTLLSLLDYAKYEVDLMLFAHGHFLQELVPKQVRILQPLEYTDFASLGLKDAFLRSVKTGEFKLLSARLRYSAGIRKGKTGNTRKAGIFWRAVSKVIAENPKVYDVAVSYAQGIPTFYVAEKTKAKKKLAWVNVSYRLDEKEQRFQSAYYRRIDTVVAVSESTKHIFLETFPECTDKVVVMHDITDPDVIRRMAEAGGGFGDRFDGVRILTIGRLNRQKGYDIALEACKRLKEQGLRFRWYALGKGPLKQEIETRIKEMGLEEHFILLGVTSNPYPYIKSSDIYVQTSRFEGFGIAIAEARMLNVPIVATRFDAVDSQMRDGKNGLVVDMNAVAVSEGIKRLIHDDGLRKNIVSYLEAEKKGNVEELDTFYQIIS